MTTSWDSAQYLRFAEERTRPCRDLAARVALSAPARIADLGCGPGNSTAVLAERWPSASLTGVDSAPDMLARARRDHPGFTWEEGDIGSWAPPRPFDLVFSNAALQWVPDHASLLPRLLGHVASGGALAVQMPGNFDAPAHRLMRELAASPGWRRDFPEPVREWHVHEIPEYYDMLAGHAARLDLWSTEYLHVLDCAAAVAEWYKGTGLRPFLDALPDAARRERFMADYTARLDEAFTPRPDGRVLFPFRRVFLVAYR
jgi:trans-aconitate 2-methyltransferase